jgi:hypothetical protein
MKLITIIMLIIKEGPVVWKSAVDIWNLGKEVLGIVKDDTTKKTPTAAELLEEVRASGTLEKLIERLKLPIDLGVK